MRDQDDVSRFLEEVIYEINYLVEINGGREMGYWLGIRDTLQWVLDGDADDFVFREDLELNKNG